MIHSKKCDLNNTINKKDSETKLLEESSIDDSRSSFKKYPKKNNDVKKNKNIVKKVKTDNIKNENSKKGKSSNDSKKNDKIKIKRKISKE